MARKQFVPTNKNIYNADNVQALLDKVEYIRVRAKALSPHIRGLVLDYSDAINKIVDNQDFEAIENQRKLEKADSYLATVIDKL